MPAWRSPCSYDIQSHRDQETVANQAFLDKYVRGAIQRKRIYFILLKVRGRGEGKGVGKLEGGAKKNIC